MTIGIACMIAVISLEFAGGLIAAHLWQTSAPYCGQCGCPRSVHQHYRPETDCSRCGWRFCPRFRAPALRIPQWS